MRFIIFATTVLDARLPGAGGDVAFGTGFPDDDAAGLRESPWLPDGTPAETKWTSLGRSPEPRGRFCGGRL